MGSKHWKLLDYGTPSPVGCPHLLVKTKKIGAGDFLLYSKGLNGGWHLLFLSIISDLPLSQNQSCALLSLSTSPTSIDIVFFHFYALPTIRVTLSGRSQR
jgi:hypothetical protein